MTVRKFYLWSVFYVVFLFWITTGLAEEISFDDWDITAPENEVSEAPVTAAEVPATPKEDLKKTTPAVSDPKEKKVSGEFSILDLWGSGEKEKKPEKKVSSEKSKKKKPTSNTPLAVQPRYRVEEVIPEFALMIVRVSSVEDFNARGKMLLEQVGMGSFGPLDWLKLSSYGKAVSLVDRKRQAAVVYIPVGAVPRMMMILPVRNYRNFAASLGVDVSALGETIPDGTISEVRYPAGYTIYPHKGYAVLSEPLPREVLEQLWQSASFREKGYFTPSGMKHPHVSLEITPLGIQHFVALGNAALSDFAPVFSEAMKSLEIEDPELNFAENYFDRATRLVNWVNGNVQSLRLDWHIAQETTLTSATVFPRADSPLHAQIQDPRSPMVPVTLDREAFLKVVPDIPSPLSGQLDVSEKASASLQPPYHRIRHVEYTFALPATNELLAESWCFFLEVNDSEAFVREMIVPNAQLIGSHIGSEKAAELGAKILGNMAVRRQQRQLGRRRPPLNPADPESAARTGEKIGAMLGGLIGKSQGEKEGMKTVDFEGYPLYISDLVFFTEQMRKIRAAQAGEVPPKEPLVLTGEFTILKLLGGSISGLLDGDINVDFQEMFPGEQGPPKPLLARQNFILVLSPHHLLIVPGNEDVLRRAKNNWERVRTLFLPPPPDENGEIPPVPLPPREWYAQTMPDTTWHQLWETIYQDVVHPEQHLLRSATQVDVAKGQLMANYLRQYYIPQLPQPQLNPLPLETPPLLSISTTSNHAAYFYTGIPNEVIRNVTSAYFKKKK
ncbi:MAG: hypothetical protein Q4D62_00935 [Planctomycetia bacterium]|nr:hypothetical protein [Planctomycetia bacterium]